MVKRLLIQLWYEASTNKYPKSLSMPLLLLKIKRPEDTLIDLTPICWRLKKDEKYKEIDKVIELAENFDGEVIANMGEYPADADKYEFFEYFLKKIKRKVSVMGTYPTIFNKRIDGFIGNNIKILQTDFNVIGIEIPETIINQYPTVGDKKRAAMKITWGCPRKCKMCPVPAIYQGKYRYFNIYEAVEQVKKYYERGVRYITFTDDNLSASVKKFNHFLRLLKQENLKGMIYNSQEGFEVEAFANEEFCQLIKELRFDDIKLGIENIKPDFLEKIGKYYTDFDIIDTAMKNIQKYDLDVRFFFLIGLDETEEDIIDNLKYFAKNKVNVRTNILHPYPKTEFCNFVYEKQVDEKTLKKLSALSYAVAFVASHGIDIFADTSFDEFIEKQKYETKQTDKGLLLLGRTNYGFLTSRFNTAIKFMYQQKTGEEREIEIIEKNKLLLKKKQEPKNKFF